MGHGFIAGTNGFVTFGLLPSIVPFISTGQVVVVATRSFTSTVGGVPSRFVVTSISLTPGFVAPTGNVPFPNPMLAPQPFLVGGVFGISDPPTSGAVGVSGPSMAGAVAVSDPPMSGVAGHSDPTMAAAAGFSDPPAVHSGTMTDQHGVNACVMSSCRLERDLTNRRLIREHDFHFAENVSPY
jgi:hypothetical protein